MKNGETMRKLAVSGAMAATAVLAVEGYLRARAFADRVEATQRQIALLRNELEALRVQADMTPRPAGPWAPATAATAGPNLVLPLPEPMRLPLPAAERQLKAPPPKAAAGAHAQAGVEAISDDGKVVLAQEGKPAPAAAGAQPAVDVKLMAKQ
ncbi:hypothetical protein [Massilia sp. erpn]|uniref:hypothetical protein n=1 Tax=Massilia sp. erpn TaxID=2738142 RepID=UPI0021035ECE|nr:hypothetical protein [Massilia sp. erpn]UTY55876.1 hypothetical protein HPQ68_00945 [Massilia sp. erpn]